MDGFLEMAAVFLFNYSCEHCFGRDFRRQRQSQPPSLPNPPPPNLRPFAAPSFPRFYAFYAIAICRCIREGRCFSSRRSAFKALSPDLLIGTGCFRWMVCGRGKQIASLVIRESSFVSRPRGQRDGESCKDEEPESSVTLRRQTRTQLGTVANDAIRLFPGNVGR